MTRSNGLSSRSHLVLGLMSGTSADGIDVALVRMAAQARTRGARPGLRGAKLENFVTLPFPAPLRAAVLSLGEGAPSSAAEIARMNFRLGELFADAVLTACRKFGVRPSRVSLIGSHGQTVYHQGVPSRFIDRPVACTLQLGEPAVIASRTGITTVGDFRPADIAAGGQGAPLVPFVDYLLYRDARRARAALNIGGIANVTVIPRNARPRNVFAFDTGPGNMVIDALVRQFTSGRQSYDRDAKWASRGALLPALLARLIAHPYFRAKPPKTAGREQFGKEYVSQLLEMARQARIGKPEDILHTATILTAFTISDALHRFVLPRVKIGQLIVSGGGARNPLIVSQLSAALHGVEILRSESLGLPGDAKEAFAFALLAHETLACRPANLPGATGAARPAVLGKICFPPPR